MSTPYSDPLPGNDPSAPVVAPAYSLFDANSVALATLLGSPIAGTILMGVNYRRLGKAGMAFAVAATGLIATILAGLFGNKLPITLSTVIAVGLLLMTRSCAQILQGPAVSDHIGKGGRLGSQWAATGLGLAVLAVIGGGIFLVVYERQLAEAGQKVTIGTRDTVYYSGSATQAQARSVGDKLKSMGYFTDRGTTVFVAKEKGGTVVSFVVKEGIWNNENMVTSFDEVAGQLAPVLGVSAVKARLINPQREVKKETMVGKAMIGQDEIFYIGSATETEARALGHELLTLGYLKNSGATVMLSKGDGTVLSFVVREGIWDEPDRVAAFENVARAAAASIGGLPLKLRLLSTSVENKKEIAIQ